MPFSRKRANYLESAIIAIILINKNYGIISKENDICGAKETSDA
jgi:hypothetical protein